MTIAQLIEELKKLDQNLKVCGESETSTWEIQPKDIETRKRNGEIVLVLGYIHE